MNYLHRPVEKSPASLKKHESTAQRQEKWVKEFWLKRSLLEEFGRSAVARAFDRSNPAPKPVKRGSIGRCHSNLSSGENPLLLITENMVDSDNDGTEHTFRLNPDYSGLPVKFGESGSLFCDEAKPRMGDN